MLGEYIVQRLIGRGGMAEVWEGVDPELDRPVAIKVILPQFVHDSTFAERFRREARLTASLRHPHIVRLYDFDLLEDQAIMVMEYLPGGTLRSRLDELARRGENLSPREIADLLDDLAAALDYAHAKGAVHRDLKPSNILFTADDEPVICDFGIAKIVDADADLTAPGGIIGTPAYIAPEQAGGGPVDARADLYSLGVMLYEMAVGRVPFTGDSPTAVLMHHLRSDPPSPRAVNPNLPETVAEVLLKALAKEPADRFQSAGELAQAYRAAIGAAGVVAETPADAAPTVRAAVLPLAGATGPAPATGPVASEPARMRWLRGVLGVSALAAALLGRSAPSADDLPNDRRGLVAMLLTTLGIFVAVLQFILNMFSVFDRSAQLFAGALPYVIVLLFLGGIALSAHTLARSGSRVRRRQAGGLLAVILVVLAGWSAWWAYAQIKPPEGFVILVGDFDSAGATEQVDVARYIAQSLDQELRHLGGLATAVRSGEVYETAAEARRSGIERDATLVIWGWYDAGGISPRIEMINIPDLDAGLDSSRLLVKAASLAPIPGALPGLRQETSMSVTDISTYVYQPAVLPSVDLFIQDGPQELAYAASAVLGIAFYANGDVEHAFEMFDRALALAEPLQDPSAIGKDRIYFHRGVLAYEDGRLEDAAADLEQAVAIQSDLYEAHYNLAMVYAQLCNPARQLARAVAAAEKAVALDPDRPQGQRLLGGLYIEQQRYDEAIAALDTAAQLEPAEPATYDLLTSAYNAAGQTEAAAAAAQQALTLYEQAAIDRPEDPVTAHLELGYAHLRAEQYPRALDEFTAAAALAPDDPAVRRALGNVYYWQGDPARAITEYRRWAELAPADVDAHLLLGLTLSEQGDVEGAIASVKQAASLHACDAGPALILASLYWQQNDLEAAADAYEQALAVEPDNAETCLLLGSTHYFQGDLDTAQAVLERAVELNSAEPEAYRALGLVYMDKEDYAAAAESFRMLTERLPDDPLGFRSLGSVYLGLSDWEGAAEAYGRAVALEPTADSRVSLAVALSQLGDSEAAISQLQQALASDPDNAGAHSTLADAFFRQGNLDDAATHYRAALESEETSYTHAQLASIYRAQNRPEDAMHELERAIELEPDNWYALYLRGELYTQSGDLDAATADYAAVLEINPEAAAAHYGLSLAAYRQCRLSAAAQAIGKAVALNENSTAFLGLQAGIYWAQNRVAEAEAIFNRLQAAPPSDWAAHLAVGDYLYQMGELDAAAQQFQMLLEAGDAASPLLSLAYTALGKIYYAQERLLPASAEYESALAAFPANAEAQALLGDIALRNGDAATALQAYDAAFDLLPVYGRYFPPDTPAMLEVSLFIRRGLALDRLGQADEAAAERDQALAAAQEFAARFPNSPAGNIALAVAYTALGETEQTSRAYAAALECDRSVELTFARFQAELAKLIP